MLQYSQIYRTNRTFAHQSVTGQKWRTVLQICSVPETWFRTMGALAEIQFCFHAEY